LNIIAGKNFETHIDTYIELHPGVNTFVGESDEGKSGIIRQLKWNSKNRPQGDSYINDQLDPKNKKDKLKVTQVDVDYKDSGLVTRARGIKSGGINHYVINDGEPLRALRSDVPDEVQDITRMKDVNIQGQHPSEQYFLLADKPGQVAKMFNKVAGLTIMDDATKDINSQVRTCNTEIKIAEKEIKIRQTEIKDTAWVDDAEKLAKKLKKYKTKIDHKQEEYDKLNDIINHLDEIDEVLARYYDGLDKALFAVSVLKKQKADIDKKNSDLISINHLILDIKSTDSKLSAYSDIDEALKALKSLDLLDDKIINHQATLNEIDWRLEKLKQNEEDLIDVEIDLKETQKEYNIIRTEQECPTCGRKGI